MLYKNVLRPLFFVQDSEKAHNRVLAWLNFASGYPLLLRAIQTLNRYDHPSLTQNLFGLHFPNPVGLAAGFSKTGAGLPALASLGFGFMEIGGVTPIGQIGNPEPRIFRAVADEALINRMGFNNPGAIELANTLLDLETRGRRPKIPIGINLGKNKDTPLERALGDYRFSFIELYHYGDFFVVNVSSPNTKNLRDLQAKESLRLILDELVDVSDDQAKHNGGQKKPILVKISPDLTQEAVRDVVEVIRDTACHGIVIANTTTSRHGLVTKINEQGGLSGPPLFERMLHLVRFARKLDSKLPIIAVGGIRSGDFAPRALRAGANLVQLYTSLVYEGPRVVPRVKRDIIRGIRRGNLLPIAKLHPDVVRS